jgi:hypothetical protein
METVVSVGRTPTVNDGSNGVDVCEIPLASIEGCAPYLDHEHRGPAAMPPARGIAT